MSRALYWIGIRWYNATVETARLLLLPLLSPFDKRLKWDLAGRNRLPRIIRGHRCRTVVWVHAASLGESKLLLRFLMVLEHRNPDDCYVVTATTRSGVEHLEAMRRPSMYAVGFLPFDSGRLIGSLLDTFCISRVWLLETELWPGMLHACFARKVPVGIANARMEERSFARYHAWRAFFSPMLEKLDIVLVQNEAYAQRFRRLGVQEERLHVVGNMKAHVSIRAPAPAEREGLRAALGLAANDIVITAGCFHAGEGALLRTAIDELWAKGRNCRCIVVPRHLRESDALAGELGDGVLRLREATAKTTWEICLIEKMGVLEALYRIADAAIVGGTFIDIGGHNVWEPAQAAIPVFFGPYHHEQRNGCEKLLAAGIGFLAMNGPDLAQQLEKALWTGKERFAASLAFFTEETNNREILVEPLIP